MAEPISGAELLARIKPQLREEATEICLRPDLVEKWETARDELAELTAGNMLKPARVGSKPQAAHDAVEKAREVQELEEQIAESSAWFRFRALPREEWQALCDDHPPRPMDQVDVMLGYNRAAVIDAAVRKCLIDPVFDDQSWTELVAVIAGGEWEELRRVVNSLNREKVEAGKSELASRILSKLADASE